jgi:hypothetical protein
MIENDANTGKPVLLMGDTKASFSRYKRES